MSTLPAQRAGAVSSRSLAALTLAVGVVHVLLLQADPAHWDPASNAAVSARPLVTRTIEIQPAPVVATAPAVPPPSRPVRPRPVISKAKPAPALTPPDNFATETVATPVDNTPPSAPDIPRAEPPPPVAEAPPRPGAATALSIPGSVRLKYAMTGRSKNLDYSAFAEMEWLQDGQNYNVRMVVSALFLGSRSMTSQGRITTDGLAPTRFLDKSRSERAAHFDADKGKITFSANTPDQPWRPGAQDRLSVFVQLGSLLAGAPANYPVGTTVALYTAGPREADTWTFLVEKEETLQLPAGEMPTLKLTRKPQRDFDQTVEIWYAPTLAYLPVRNRITQQNGDFVDQQLRSTEKP